MRMYVSRWVSAVAALLIGGIVLLACVDDPNTTPPESVETEIASFFYQTVSPGANSVATLEFVRLRAIFEEPRRSMITAVIGPEAIFDGYNELKLGELFSDGLYPFDEAKSIVNYNGRGILQVSWTVRATGSYSSTTERRIAVDTRSGRLIGPEAMFNDDVEVARFVNLQFAPRLARLIKSYYQAHQSLVISREELRNLLDYRPELLFDAMIQDTGMTFYLPLSLPPSLPPFDTESLSVFVPWSKLKPFSYPGSILERFPAFR